MLNTFNMEYEIETQWNKIIITDEFTFIAYTEPLEILKRECS